VVLKTDLLDVTAGKLGKQELYGREIGPLVLVLSDSAASVSPTLA
jgi:hypothetical protein